PTASSAPASSRPAERSSRSSARRSAGPRSGGGTQGSVAPRRVYHSGMATKAERFKQEQLRARPKKPKQELKRTKGRRRAPTGPEADATTSGHNYKAGEKGKEAYAYEYSSGRPSRKSTRISEEHVKTGTELQIRQINRVHSPKARAGRRG